MPYHVSKKHTNDLKTIYHNKSELYFSHIVIIIKKTYIHSWPSLQGPKCVLLKCKSITVHFEQKWLTIYNIALQYGFHSIVAILKIRFKPFEQIQMSSLVGPSLRNFSFIGQEVCWGEDVYSVFREYRSMVSKSKLSQ